MPRKIHLLKETFEKLCNVIINEDIAFDGIEERFTQMKADSGLNTISLPMDDATVFNRWQLKQKDAEKAMFDGGIGDLPKRVGYMYDECIEEPTEKNLSVYRKNLYNLLSFWAQSADAITNKLSNGKITGILEPKPIGSDKFNDFFGIICKLYYLPCALESLYCDEYFAKLRQPFDDMISAALVYCNKMKNVNPSLSSFGGHNIKLLFPLEWREFAQRRRGLKDGSISPKLSAETPFDDDDEPTIDINDNDFV